MSYSFPCNWKASFVQPTSAQQRIGYLTAFDGLGLPSALNADLQVFCPYQAPSYTPVVPHNGMINVVAVIENIDWEGTVGGALKISSYMLGENANRLTSLKQMTLKNTSFRKIGWWVADYDVANKKWFEEFYPKALQTLTAQLNMVSKNDIRLLIADNDVRVAANIEIRLYNVYLEILPAADQPATFFVASSATKNVTLPWGHRVGGG